VQSVEIRVRQADLADTLTAMRVWLDRERCVLLHFRHAGDGMGSILINAGFAVDDLCAERFRKQFVVG